MHPTGEAPPLLATIQEDDELASQSMKSGGGVESSRCEVEAAGITVSVRPHPLKIWSRPNDLLLDATGDPAALAPLPVSHNSRCRLVLRNVSCRARPGELLAIIGPSGAGKSTLLKILSSRLEPSFSPPTDLRVNDSPVDTAALR
ncbi:hypothetical protein VPH35_052401 [Triticum aestivum]|uniref:ABC transporter domain-containing protein n=1 Tax=Triticum turgidum subsp. durum TaxID=4567 RepID=A0A9R1S1Y5_TRITD|nr:unnamed protein product [Triticum turgidum subsp. durum]